MSQQSVSDSDRVYCTNALVKRVGGAVAISLEDATLPGMAKNKHMTILFRRGKKWSNDEIELISKESDTWIKQKYGSNQAPVTFTTAPWGKKSVQINGDLNTLCLHLRGKFGSMSNDDQRIPHVELFKNGRNNGRNHKDKDRACHICGESGHFKKYCPQKEDKKGRKYRKDHGDKSCHICGDSGHFRKNCPNKENKKFDKKNDGRNNSEKVKQRLEKMISKMHGIKQQKQREIELLDEQEKQLQELLNNADNLDNKTIRNEIKNIAKSFKNKHKEFKGRNGANGKRRKFGIKKVKRSKQSKQERKELNKEKKEQRKLEKEQRKRLKKEKLNNLTSARLEILPLNKTEIGDSDILYIYVDGYNIIGCDSLCRRNMRGRGGGMKKSRSRLAKLLQENFLNKYKSNELKLEYNPIIYLWFDGNGKNGKYQDIEITFSTKKQIVDDKLVEKFSKNDKKQNSNILVITADKELTLRLYKIGVKVMKSSTFYKTYLNEKKQQNVAPNPTDDNDDDNDDDEKKEEFVENTNDNDNDDDFVQVIANKMNSQQYEDEDTPDGDYGDYDDDDDDEGDYTPDEIEGSHYYQTPGNEEDYEFTEIFGEDMDIIHDD